MVRITRPALVAIIGSGLLLALVFALAQASSGPEAHASPIVGRGAPAVAGPTLQGTTFDLARHRGRWVVVNFFSTTCPPCIVEHPELARFQARNDQRAAVVSIAIAGDEASAVEFFSARGGTWPLLADPNQRMFVDFGVIRLPESFIIDPTGRVTAHLLGGVTVEDLETAIETSAAIIDPSTSEGS